MSKLEQLLSRKMTRKQFLLTLGVGCMSLFGLSSIMGLLSQTNSDKNTGPPGYGLRDYGE